MVPLAFLPPPLYLSQMRLLASLLLLASAASARTAFWTPANPPRAAYTIEARLDPDKGRLEGAEIIRFRNDSARPIGRLALRWDGEPLRVRANNADATPVPDVPSVKLFDLPKDIAPGESVELRIDFTISRPPLKDGEGGATAGWYPRLWWGIGTQDDYEVRLSVPAGFTVATSAPLAGGVYRARNLRNFVLFVGRGFETAEADAGPVRVRTVFTAKGSRCAQLLLQTAVDAISFYQKRFGFYPHTSLTIVPGGDYPAGGYPIGSAVVAVHGQERFNERGEAWWQWITAHEIGHMYWSEYVLAQGADSLDWLMIGLGIYADREYRRARAIKDAGELWPTYASGAAKGYDTTLDATPQQVRRIKWDFNNVVIHGKSSAALNALESVIGAKTFDSVYRRCLRDYAGKPLGWREFQRVAETESGQNLDWFFDQWVRSSAFVNYRIAGQDCTRGGTAFDCTVRVKREGPLRMPVTVAAHFEDGSEQRATTERLADEDIVRFRAASALKTAAIEPDAAVALVEPPPMDAKNIQAEIEDLPWSGAGDRPVAIYRKLSELGELIPLKIALLLYDGKHYPEALEAFANLETSPTPILKFTALVWQGHILDLTGKRAEALAKYEAALKLPGEPSMQHGQYNLTINKQWVQDRLKTPFTR